MPLDDTKFVRDSDIDIASYQPFFLSVNFATVQVATARHEWTDDLAVPLQDSNKENDTTLPAGPVLYRSSSIARQRVEEADHTYSVANHHFIQSKSSTP